MFCYITCVMLCYITFVMVMLCYITYVMFSYITCVMLCYITYVMFCYITCVMFCYITCVVLRYNICHVHRRTGHFLPGGAVNHLPKKITQVAQIFTKESKRNESHIATTQAVLARYGFSGSIRSLSINYVAINKHLEKLRPQLY